MGFLDPIEYCTRNCIHASADYRHEFYCTLNRQYFHDDEYCPTPWEYEPLPEGRRNDQLSKEYIDEAFHREYAADLYSRYYRDCPEDHFLHVDGVRVQYIGPDRKRRRSSGPPMKGRNRPRFDENGWRNHR